MSYYPTFENTSRSNNGNANDIIFAARVKDILLTNTQKLFDNTAGWSSLGTIQFKPLFDTVDNGINNNLLAKPLFSNLKNYPLKEELVLILKAPSYDINNNPNSSDFYYFPYPIGIWNNTNHNSLPDIDKYNKKPGELIFGNSFEENEVIKSLLPEEGDFIIEGRFGNSIRFSSTIKKGKNSWSDVGKNGSPITIIRNGQYVEDNDEHPWIPTYEDINKDDSSIYMTSGQEIPLELACKNLQSFNVTLSNSFNSSLQILDGNKF